MITEKHIKKITESLFIFIMMSLFIYGSAGIPSEEAKHIGLTAGVTEQLTAELYNASQSEVLMDAVSIYEEKIVPSEKAKKISGAGINNADLGADIIIDSNDTGKEPEYLTPTVIASYDVPNWEAECHSEAYTYMGYNAVHTRSTTQYRILNADYAYTDEVYGIRSCHTLWGDRYYVAIGQGYNAPAGTLINVILEDGSSIPCVVGDLKKWTECDVNLKYHMLGDGSVVEIVVDYSYFGRNSEQYRPIFHGKVERIEVCAEHI